MTAPAREQAVRAIRSLRSDYASWARRCYRIRDKHGQIRPLILNEVQLAIGAAEREALRTKGQFRGMVLKARQGGVSTDQQGRNLHQVWREPGFDALTLAHTRDDTDRLFEITQRAVEHFPPALLPRLGGKETREISFPGLDTHFYTGTAGSKRTGRGMTIKRFHGSEFAFWDEPLETLGTVTPALVPVGSSVTLETTGSGFDSEAHNFWRECAARGYQALFFPWWTCDALNYRLPLFEPDELGVLAEDEALLMARHGLDLEQIKWRRAKIAELGRGKFLNEYAEDPESCWAAVGGMFYDVELLKALLLRAPVPRETHLGGSLELFDDVAVGERRYMGPNPERIIIGCDTAEGGGGDRSTWTARSFPSWRLVAKYEDARVTPEDLAGILNTWGRQFGTALLVVEKNAHGITVLRKLRDVHQYPLQWIYHRAPLDQQHEQQTERIGWATTAESKPLLLDAGRELLHAARDGNAGLPSQAALRDAFGVRRDEKGQVKLNGKDVLVSEMLCWIGRTAPVQEFLFGSVGGARR